MYFCKFLVKIVIFNCGFLFIYCKSDNKFYDKDVLIIFYII